MDKSDYIPILYGFLGGACIFYAVYKIGIIGWDLPIIGVCILAGIIFLIEGSKCDKPIELNIDDNEEEK